VLHALFMFIVRIIIFYYFFPDFSEMFYFNLLDVVLLVSISLVILFTIIVFAY